MRIDITLQKDMMGMMMSMAGMCYTSLSTIKYLI